MGHIVPWPARTLLVMHGTRMALSGDRCLCNHLLRVNDFARRDESD